MFKNLYITELQKNHYDKAKKHYNDKNNYLIDVTKVKEHSTDANILKNLVIPTSKDDQIAASIAKQNITMTKSIESAITF
jgi:hypothetical protein